MMHDPYERLSATQRGQLADFQEQLLFFNRRLNLVSRDTEAVFEERHLLHSLALTYRAFPPGCTVVDWGTGGGLPVIPLAICFPEVTFYAVDAVGKKIQTVRTMGRRLGLKNLHPWHGRAEAWSGRAHYSISRATAPLADLWGWHLAIRDTTLPVPSGDYWLPGLICLKGGNLDDEIAVLKRIDPALMVDEIPLPSLFKQPFFIEKNIITVRSGDEPR